MRFFENYLKKEINFCNEINNIEFLMNNRMNNSDSIYQEISDNFLNWSFRKTDVTLNNFLDNSGLRDIIDRAKNNDPIKLDEFLSYIEFIFTIIKYYEDINFNSSFKYDLIIPISNNLKIILNKINFEIQWVKKEDDKYYAICIEKNFIVRESSEIVNDNDLAEKIFMYNHYSLKGNLYEKAIILSRLYMYFEGIKNLLNSNNFGSMVQLLSGLSNKLKIRHKPKEKETVVVEDLSDEELESAYDDVFETYLTAIVIERYLNKKDKLIKLKDKFDKKENK